MTNMRVEYLGDKRCELLHEASNSKIYTDAPTDNFGKGAFFSPTDLMSSSLGACMLTIMGIKLEPLGAKLNGSFCTLKKLMSSNPRKVSKIEINLQMCSGIQQEHRIKIDEITKTCPVFFSLDPKIIITINITYPD